MTQRTMIWSL